MVLLAGEEAHTKESIVNLRGRNSPTSSFDGPSVMRKKEHNAHGLLSSSPLFLLFFGKWIPKHNGNCVTHDPSCDSFAKNRNFMTCGTSYKIEFLINFEYFKDLED